MGKHGTICGALRVPGFDPVVLGFSSPAEHRSAGPSLIPPQPFYEGLRGETVPSSSLAAVPPSPCRWKTLVWLGNKTTPIEFFLWSHSGSGRLIARNRSKRNRPKISVDRKLARCNRESSYLWSRNLGSGILRRGQWR